MTRLARRFAAFAALAGVVFSALLPLASAAAPGTRTVPLMICASGTMQPAPAGFDIPVPPASAPREHCALCLGAIQPVVPATPPALVVTAIGTGVVGIESREDPQLAFVPPRPPSQAPPRALFVR